MGTVPSPRKALPCPFAENLLPAQPQATLTGLFSIPMVLPVPEGMDSHSGLSVWLLSLSITPLRLIYLVACVSIGWAVFHDLSIHLLVDDCFQFGVIMRKVALNVISLSFLNLYTKHKTKKSEQLTHLRMLNCIFYIQKNINLSTEMSPLSKYCLKYGHSKNMWIQFFYLWKKGKK